MMFSLIELIFTIVIVLAMIFSLQQFFMKSGNRNANIYLGFYFLFLCVYYVLNTPYINQVSILKHSSFLFLLTINPFYYFYVKNLTDESRRYVPNYRYHFIPVCLFLITNICTYLLMPVVNHPITFQQEFHTHDVIGRILGLPSSSLAILTYCLQILIYSILIVVELRKHNRNIKNHFSDISKITLNWIYVLVSATIFFTIIDALSFFNIIQPTETISVMYFLLMIVYVSFLGLFGLRQPGIYKGQKNKVEEIRNMDTTSNDNPMMEQSLDDAEGLKYANSRLTEEQKIEIFNRLSAIMKEQKPYLNPKITIEDLATLMGINKKYLSQVINEMTKDNFYMFINRHRVDEAKQMLLNKEFDHLSIEGIGNSVGFNSRSVFNSAFKQLENVTPTQFKTNARG